MKHVLGILFIIILLFSCKENEARRPISVKTGSFLQESAERNRQLLAREEAMIQQLIQQDSTRSYLTSAFGAWYTYQRENPEADYMPKPEDLVRLTYELRTLGGELLYSREELGEITYKVDKEELFPGLRNAVKLLKEGEAATFYFPSSMGYGYHGDNDRIGTNMPLVADLEIRSIIKNDSL